MKKKILLIAGILLASLTVVYVFAQQYNSERDFDIMAEVTITGYPGNNTVVNIPPRIQNMPVTRIGSQAFHRENLSAITIPDSVTHIGVLAFANNNLTSVNIPNSVIEIARTAFQHNPISRFTVAPYNENYSSRDNFLLSKDGEELFAYYGTEKNISIPNGVTAIKSWTFVIWAGDAEGGIGLTGVTITNSVTSIEAMAFFDYITRITIGANVILNVGGNSSSSSFELINFDAFYNDNGRRAGTYTLNNGRWSRN